MKPNLLALLLVISVVTSNAFAETSKEWQERTRLAGQLDIGESAPDWLVDSESYAIGYNPDDWDSLAQSKVAFITHCPVNREFFQRCHALGIRCFPYVTFYQGFASQTYEGVNLKDHPEFIEVDAQGNLKRTGFWESEDAKNMYTTCPNVTEYQDAMVAWVKRVMELGADGVFVDNLGSRAACFGPKFGKHKHLHSGTTSDANHAFAMLLKRVREIVKQYQPEGAVLGNSASPLQLPKEFWKHLDAEMLESYICTWVSKDRWFDWKAHWNKAGKDLQPHVKAGKQIQALSYLGHTPYGIREDAFFCYASARLAGFVWNGGQPLSQPDSAVLYRLRLGKPLTDEREENGVHYRVFERGLVAVNPDKGTNASITLSPPMPTRRLFDVFGNGASLWSLYPGGGYSLDFATKHGGTRSMTCLNKKAADASGATQGIELNQTKPVPIVLGGWSRAENVSGAADGNYSLYVDALYTDGTPLHG
ncbi:MAG: putative glycoside hydrolase, partial [Limisphaerales bacterium]